MRGITVIIPSKTITNLDPCVEAIGELHREADVGIKFTIIDDGVDWSLSKSAKFWIDKCDGDQVLMGVKPFSFPANVNIGIRAAGDDIVVCNDDAILKTELGFLKMQAAHYREPKYGILSATTNVAGNPDQHPVGPERDVVRDAGDRNVAFVCVFIPRSTIDAVGLMDEEFGGVNDRGETVYGFCDSSMVHRIRLARLRVGIFDGCFMDHGSLRSTFRGDPRTPANLGPGLEIFIKKWGFNPFHGVPPGTYKD